MKNVLLLLANGFEFVEASVFIDVIGWNMIDGDQNTKLYTCGFQKEVPSAFNHKVVVDYLISEVDCSMFDALAIPGGFEVFHFYDFAYNEQFLDIIRKCNAENKIIASVCVGALPLAKSGILQAKKATTYNSEIRRKTLQDFGAHVLHQPIVIDDNIITSWNPATAFDVAFLLLEKLTTKQNSDTIKSLMGF